MPGFFARNVRYPIYQDTNLLQLCLKHKFKNLPNQNDKRNLSNPEFAQFKKRDHINPWNFIRSSVSSMTSAKEGQPPSNEPEEVLQIASVAICKCC